jgi:chemotaxis protein methyltransferase CheR
VTPPDYEYLRKLLKDHSGLDLSADKQYLIESRLLPLSRKCGVPGIGELVQKMKGGSSSIIAQVVEAMTTNETFFFRDKVPFDHFRDAIMPEMLKARAGIELAHDVFCFVRGGILPKAGWNLIR